MPSGCRYLPRTAWPGSHQQLYGLFARLLYVCILSTANTNHTIQYSDEQTILAVGIVITRQSHILCLIPAPMNQSCFQVERCKTLFFFLHKIPSTGAQATCRCCPLPSLYGKKGILQSTDVGQIGFRSQVPVSCIIYY